MQELERQFKAGGGKFEDYKIGDLFSCRTGDVDVQRKHLNGKGQLYINSGVTNMGIIGRTDYPAAVFPSNTITVDMFGNAYFRDFEYKMATHAHVFSLNFLPCSLKGPVGLYICTQMKYFTNLFSFSNMCNWTKMKGMTINLPTLHGEIFFSYMVNVIRELKKDRIIQLNAYLKSSGLENTELSQEEKDAVNKMRNGDVEWKEFKVGELFDIHPTNAYKLTNSHIFHADGKNPVVTNSSVNNGVTGYSNLNPTERGNMITYSDTTTSEGIFYQSDDFVGYPHVQGLYPKRDSDKWNDKTLLFFVSVFRKSAGGRFDYANKFNRTIASQMLVSLPIHNGAIDWDFMQNLITAESRLAIRGVVEWKDKV